jgi:hypothetical protein
MDLDYFMVTGILAFQNQLGKGVRLRCRRKRLSPRRTQQWVSVTTLYRVLRTVTRDTPSQVTGRPNVNLGQGYRLEYGDST